MSRLSCQNAAAIKKSNFSAKMVKTLCFLDESGSSFISGNLGRRDRRTASRFRGAAVEIFYLCLFAFLAGFVDSIVGGGGLIQLPALFIFLPPAIAAQVPVVLGTNKFSSICGTAVATGQYVRKVRLDWRILLPAAASAFVFAFLGARTVSLLNPKV